VVGLSALRATCADLRGVPLPGGAGEDSVSILPALLGRASGPVHEAVVHQSTTGRFAIRRGSWKLELCPGSGGSSPPRDWLAAVEHLPTVQLYDMSTDGGEGKNVEAEHPEVVSRLTELLERYV